MTRKSWIAPSLLAVTTWPAGWLGGQALFKIVAFYANQQGCEVCFRPTDATPTLWSLSVGIAFLGLALAWLVLLGWVVVAAFRRKSRRLAHVIAALALLGLFGWASH
jgi:hypothetical protein